MKNVKLIGGTHHDSVCSIESDQVSVKLRQKRTGFQCVIGEESKYELYSEIEVTFANMNTVKLWVHESIDSHNVIEHLVKDYCVSIV